MSTYTSEMFLKNLEGATTQHFKDIESRVLIAMKSGGYFLVLTHPNNVYHCLIDCIVEYLQNDSMFEGFNFTAFKGTDLQGKDYVRVSWMVKPKSKKK